MDGDYVTPQEEAWACKLDDLVTEGINDMNDIDLSFLISMLEFNASAIRYSIKEAMKETNREELNG